MQTIVLIHGLWLNPLSWEGWKERFESRGHQVLTPPWPHMEAEVEKLRRAPVFANCSILASAAQCNCM